MLLLGGALLVATGVFARGQGASEGAAELKAAATVERGRVDNALASAMRAVEPSATAAAHLPEIVSGLDLDADPHTFEDLLQTEDWWAPYRARFQLSAVVTMAASLATLGPIKGDLSGIPIVVQARNMGVASGVVSEGGRAFLVGAARVPPGKRRASNAVVILGVPLDQPAFEMVAQAAAAPVALSDGQKLLVTGGLASPDFAATGPQTAQAALAALVGREERAIVEGVVSVGGGRSGTAWPLVAVSPAGAGAGSRLWLLALVPAAPPPTAPLIGLVVVVAGALLGASGLAVQLSARVRRAAAGGKGAGGGEALPVAAFESTYESGPISAAGPAAAQRNGSTPAPAPANGSALRGARLTPPAGSGLTLGRYRLLERIGEGGMAEIFIAAAHGAEGFVRQFVVKRMHAHLARSRDAVNQFIDEARLQSALVHSNIVPVFDFGRAGDEYFMALEYIHGRSLERVVRRHVEVLGRPLSLSVAFYVLYEVLEALGYAHGQTDHEGKTMGIVHRDVTPGNILISRRGEVKLSDFGIAKSEGRVSHTEVGLIKGNVSFMSPEQARGDAVDHRSDMFSVAVVLYFCLTGQLLYSDETMFQRLVRAATGPAMTEFTQVDELAPVAADVLKKGLALDPAKRYQNAKAFARDLAGHFTAGRTELAELMETLFPELQRERHQPPPA